jgi:multiple sugar transport system permease protein
MAVLPVEIFCGFGLALLLNSDIRYKNIFRLAFIMPIFLTPIVTAVMWKLIFLEEFGVANYFLSIIGIPPTNWLGTTNTALLSIAIVWVWRFIGFNAVLLEAGLASLPVEPFDSAKIDGASSFQTLKHITIPLLKPVFVVVLILRSMVVFRMFQLVYAMTEGGPGDTTEVLGLYIYKAAFIYTDMGFAAASSWILLAIIALLSIIYINALRRR